MSEARALQKLQGLDLRLMAVEQRLREIAAAIADDEGLVLAAAALAAAKAECRPIQARQKELEHALEDNEAKARATDARLYSGAVQNPKELADMQQELQSLQRRHEELEEVLLQALEAADEAQAKTQKAQENWRQAEEASALDKADWLAERARLLKERAALRGEREMTLPALGAAILTKYHQLARKKSGRALAFLGEGRCLACGVSLSSALEQRVRHDTLPECQNCGRLLVVE